MSLPAPADPAVAAGLTNLIASFESRSIPIMSDVLPAKVLLFDHLYSEAVKRRQSAIEWTANGCRVNPVIMQLTQTLKSEIHVLLDILDPLKMTIQLNIPKMADQKGVSVSVKEEIVEMLQACRISGIQILDSVTNYYAKRGKLVSKCLKFPCVADYKRVVEELDEKQYTTLINMCLDVRNNYCFILDYCMKNADKLKAKGESEAYSHIIN